MATKPLTFRLDPKLVSVLDEQAKIVGRDRATHLTAIVESHLLGNGDGQPSEESLRRHDQILEKLETISAEAAGRHDQTFELLQSVSAEATDLTRAVAQKEREASGSFSDLRKHSKELRADIATLFAAALQSFAGVEEKDAIAFTQKFMYSVNGRA
jgi:hypothetical protein